MQLYCQSLTEYKRLATREVKIGDLLLGNFHPIRVQTMTTTDTMDTIATVEQSIRCIEAGAELVRITAPSKNEAANLLAIKNELRKRGYTTPLVADIHFTPNAAEIAARIVEKVRVNPGNYVDKKKFERIEYTDADYAEEIDRIRDRFTPLIKICKEYGTAMRIGTNHGSLSDRIMSRYGDTPVGMVESAMEFLRIARDESYHNIVLSMKASNPQVMVQAYRLLVKSMFDEWGECYPLHLGVTEAGDGEDGRVKSAVGIGTLLEDGLGDTIRVSLTEDPELEIPVCKDLVKRYASRNSVPTTNGNRNSVPITNGNRNSVPIIHRNSVPTTNGNRNSVPIIHPNSVPITNGNRNSVPIIHRNSVPTNHRNRVPASDPFHYQRRETFAIDNIGGKHVPVVIADMSKIAAITPSHLQSVGYTYDQATDKWNISDAAADYIFTGNQLINFSLPGTLKVIVYPHVWQNVCKTSPLPGDLFIALSGKEANYFPIYEAKGYIETEKKSDTINFVMLDCYPPLEGAADEGSRGRIEETPLNGFRYLDKLANDKSVVLCLSSKNAHAMAAVRRMFIELQERKIKNPVVLITDSNWQTADEHLVHFATETGALLLDGFGDGICLGITSDAYKSVNRQLSTVNASGRNYLNNQTTEQFINNTAFSILQATRTRISKTEYISCPSCGRTLFDLQETTAKIRARTNHLKGVKIAIMGCIVNGPGEMADADFGYVGSGPGKITLYKGKEVMKRNVNSEVAVEELINLLKQSEAWIAP